VTWTAPNIDGTGDGSVTLSDGVNQPAAPLAPTVDSVGVGQVTLTAAAAAAGESSGAITVGPVTVSGTATRVITGSGAITTPGIVANGFDRRPQVSKGFWDEESPSVYRAREEKSKQAREEERRHREALRKAYEEVTGEAEPETPQIPEETRREVVEAAVMRVADDWQLPTFDFDAQLDRIEALFAQIETEAREAEETKRRRRRDVEALLLLVA